MKTNSGIHQPASADSLNGKCRGSRPVLKPPLRTIAIILGLVALPLHNAVAADLAAEFSTGPEGWISVSHTNQNPPLPAGGITATDPSPQVANGFLRVQDLNNDWQWIKAPAAFLGDWQKFASIKLGLVTDEAATIYPIVLFISGTSAGTTHSATFQFPLAGTPGSSRLDLTAPLQASQWTLRSGSWSSLIADVQEFWIRLDLNSGVPQELDLVDYVRLVDGSVDSLKIHRAVEVEFFAPLGASLQLETSTDLHLWKAFGPVFTGDGTQQSRFIRIGDQKEVFFRLVRDP
jgi:hypothetical protein